MGGEKHLSGTTDNRPQGSPPHGRGKDESLSGTGERKRITPALAGKRAQERFFVFCHEDHPRVGGEKGPRPGQVGPLPGSPPHGRGKAALADAVQYVVGITPRMGGEKPVAMHSLTTKAGSPPRGRGKGWQTFWPCAAQGDHPRMGGEKGHTYKKRLFGGGSPPHGRGKARGVLYSVCKERITPAWAGKRPHATGYILPCWDHPRMGGEKSSFPITSVVGGGSPPHGRGKGPKPGNKPALTRITPAWAGKRSDLRLHRTHEQDHPRMGGEKKKI